MAISNKNIFDKIFYKISGDVEDYSFEHRFFNAVLFFTIFIGILSTIVNIFISLYLSAISTALIPVVSYIMYVKSKKTKKYKVLVKIFIAMTTIWIIYLWLVNSGSYGPVGYTFFVVILVFNIIYNGNNRGLINIALVSLMSLLLLSEYFFPELIYQSSYTKEKRFWDVFFSSLTLLLLYSYVISFLINIFNEERDKVIKQRDLIFEKNEEIKATQAELYEHKENLEKLVKQRTIALEKEKEKAEKSDRLKTAFLANMSHEIRTPMNAILGLSKIIKEKDLTIEKRNEYIDVINKKGQVLLNLINDIIDIAKIESNELKISPEVCNVSDILKDIYLSFQNTINSNKCNIELKLSMSQKIVNTNIITDQLRLKQVLFNLVENARKFTEKGYIKIGADLQDEKILKIYVEDTGVGIPKEKQDVIFDRFRQIEEINTKSHEGTGLGLAISKKIIELLNGKIYLESKEGEGTTFFIELPVTIVDSNTQAGENTVFNSEETINWSDKKILIAEDEEFNFIILRDLLNETGINITWAKNGEEVLNLINDSFNIILLDIQMPKISGYDLCPILVEKHPNIPVIAQTAYVFNEEKQKLLSLGCKDIITKPIDFDTFLNTIKRYLI